MASKKWQDLRIGGLQLLVINLCIASGVAYHQGETTDIQQDLTTNR